MSSELVLLVDPPARLRGWLVANRRPLASIGVRIAESHAWRKLLAGAEDTGTVVGVIPLREADQSFDFAEVLTGREPRDTQIIWYLAPQHVEIELEWRWRGFRTGQRPSEWVSRRAVMLDPAPVEEWLARASTHAHVHVRSGADVAAGDRDGLADFLASVASVAPEDLQRVRPSEEPPPLDLVAILHWKMAQPSGLDPAVVAAAYGSGFLAQLEITEASPAAQEGRRVLEAWCGERFGADNARILLEAGTAPSPATSSGPGGTPSLAELDRLWVREPTVLESALLDAVAAHPGQAGPGDSAEGQQDLARVRSEAARLRAELDRLRGRRAVRAALAVASLSRPAFRLARGQKGRPSRRVEAVTPSVVDVGPVEARSDIVVCVHDALDDVRRCLDSVVRHTDLTTHRLVVVDDGSGPETATFLRTFAEPDSVTLIRHDDARGYTVAAEAGISAGDAPFAVLLNSDTIVTPQWLDGLLEVVLEDPLTAVVGPWSNAASWQSVPELTDEAGGWHLNPLPLGQTPDDVAAAVAIDQPLRPEIPLVNGFCYLLRRSAYDAVGGLDTENFPRGYGEEDDLSLRLTAEGYRLRVADDVYVHHAKSRSFTPEGRARIVETSKQILRDKHGADRVREVVTSVQHAEGLVRARTWAALRIEASRRSGRGLPRLTGRPSIAWVQPHLEEVGGIRRAITMSNLMREWGAEPTLVTPDGEPTNWLPIRAEVLGIDEAARRTYDIVVLSDPDMVGQSLRIEAGRRVIYHLAAYMKYRPLDDRLRAYYDIEGLHLANSRWTADAVEEFTGVHVAGIVPGAVDPATFHPVRTRTTHDVVCYGSARAHKGTATIVEAARGLELLKLVDLYLPQSGLATGICSGRVFASGAWHEGFNLPPLEAMACGVPVVMTDDGGSRDYARDGENALVVPVGDARAMRQALRRLLDDEPLRARLIDQGLRTAARYTWESATTTFLEAVLGAKV